MAGVNKVIIIGRLGAKPELRTTQGGIAMCSLSVATSESWNDQATGERREVTEWHRITMFRRLAEIAAQYLNKGSLVYIEGKLKTRKYQDQNGQDRYATDIIADNMQMLESKNANNGGGNFQGGFNQNQGSFQNNNFGQNQNFQNNQAPYQGQSYNNSMNQSQPKPAMESTPMQKQPEIPENIDDDIPF